MPYQFKCFLLLGVNGDTEECFPNECTFLGFEILTQSINLDMSKNRRGSNFMF